MTDQYFESNEFKEKLHKYENAMQNGQSLYLEPSDLTDIAEYYHLKENDKEALHATDYALTLFPGATDPLTFRARYALLKENDGQKALQWAEQIEDKTDLEYFYIIAEIKIVGHDTDGAAQYLKERMKEIDDDDLEDYVLDVATLFADYDAMDKAQEWLDLSEETDVPNYKELQGRIALNKGNYKESEDIFNELLDEDPFSSPYWNRLASSQFMRNHINDSITSSEFSIAINPNDEEAILNKANGLFSLENYEEALIYYRRFTHLCPKEETGYLFQGITLLNLNRTQEAQQKLKEAEEKAGKESSNLLEIYQQLSFTLSHLDHLDEALSYIDKAEKLNDTEQGEMNVLRGHLLLEHERLKEAQVYFQKALSESKDSPSIILHIAISVYDCGYLKFSYKLFKELYYTEKGSNMLEGYSYFAMCCRDMGHNEEYLQVLKKACEQNPSEAKNVLGEYFPQEVEPSQYYQYALTHPKE